MWSQTKAENPNLKFKAHSMQLMARIYLRGVGKFKEDMYGRRRVH